MFLFGASAGAQQVVPLDFVSVGRGAPLEDDANDFPLTGAAVPFNPGIDGGVDFDDSNRVVAAMNGDSPRAIWVTKVFCQAFSAFCARLRDPGLRFRI
jgi:hypothetical protein